MSGDPFVGNDNSNGEYCFDPNAVRAGVVATAIALLLIWSSRNLRAYAGGLHFQRPDREFDPLNSQTEPSD
jgi:hypothetical protein